MRDVRPLSTNQVVEDIMNRRAALLPDLNALICIAERLVPVCGRRDQVDEWGNPRNMADDP